MDKKQKKVFTAVIGILIVLVVIFLALQHKSKVIPENVGNECCPVTGRSVDGINTYTHEGKEYNLCSPDCVQKMSDSPEVYTKAQEASGV